MSFDKNNMDQDLNNTDNNINDSENIETVDIKNLELENTITQLKSELDLNKKIINENAQRTQAAIMNQMRIINQHHAMTITQKVKSIMKHLIEPITSLHKYIHDMETIDTNLDMIYKSLINNLSSSDIVLVSSVIGDVITKDHDVVDREITTDKAQHHKVSGSVLNGIKYKSKILIKEKIVAYEFKEISETK